MERRESGDRVELTIKHEYKVTAETRNVERTTIRAVCRCACAIEKINVNAFFLRAFAPVRHIHSLFLLGRLRVRLYKMQTCFSASVMFIFTWKAVSVPGATCTAYVLGPILLLGPTLEVGHCGCILRRDI